MTLNSNILLDKSSNSIAHMQMKKNYNPKAFFAKSYEHIIIFYREQSTINTNLLNTQVHFEFFIK